MLVLSMIVFLRVNFTISTYQLTVYSLNEIPALVTKVLYNLHQKDTRSLKYMVRI